MRNKSSNVQVTKKRLSKCEGVFRSYSDIQLQYANLLESDVSILEFKCNVVLDDFEVDGTYTTDFLITKTNGDILIRECVFRNRITKPLNIKHMVHFCCLDVIVKNDPRITMHLYIHFADIVYRPS